MITPRDSFAFLPGITESWLILSSHFVTGLKAVSKMPLPVKMFLAPLGFEIFLEILTFAIYVIRVKISKIYNVKL